MSSLISGELGKDQPKAGIGSYRFNPDTGDFEIYGRNHVYKYDTVPGGFLVAKQAVYPIYGQSYSAWGFVLEMPFTPPALGNDYANLQGEVEINLTYIKNKQYNTVRMMLRVIFNPSTDFSIDANLLGQSKLFSDGMKCYLGRTVNGKLGVGMYTSFTGAAAETELAEIVIRTRNPLIHASFNSPVNVLYNTTAPSVADGSIPTSSISSTVTGLGMTKLFTSTNLVA